MCRPGQGKKNRIGQNELNIKKIKGLCWSNLYYKKKLGFKVGLNDVRNNEKKSKNIFNLISNLSIHLIPIVFKR